MTNDEIKKTIEDFNLEPLFTKPNDIAVYEGNLYVIRQPKRIGKISICGAFQIEITDVMRFNKPTKEQIKNLHDFFNIDVELYDE
jgi:hypothetical protein